jgi:hypothetical protein
VFLAARPLVCQEKLEVVAGDGCLDNIPITEAALPTLQTILVDPAGNLFGAEGCIYKIDAKTGILTTLSAPGSGFNGDGLSSRKTKFFVPIGLALDAAGNLDFA